jgi:ankyrin repeat protein
VAHVTALHWSVRRGPDDLTVRLIEKGAAVGAVTCKWDRRGQTPLDVALEDQNERHAKFLRDAGARQ